MNQRFPQTVEEMEARLKQMSPQQLDDFKKLIKPMLAKAWLPQPGPQTEAYYNHADETLYGGAAGGGKTDLLLGLATTRHERTVLFRRQSVDLETIWNRLMAIAKGRVVKADSNRKKMRLNDSRFIEFGHLEKPGSEKGWQGNPHDLYAFDEAAQLDEAKVKFVLQWKRSTTPGQRTRAVFATNPPIPEFDRDGKIVDTGTGAWLKEWFAPWLEETFPDPAQPGELRWCFMVTEGDRNVTIWVEGEGGYDPETHKRLDSYTQDDVLAGKVMVAFSRTFIKSLLKDNVFLKNTGYAANLSATPEPLRSLLLNGSFTVKGEDHPFQVIPTLWVLGAQERWRATVNAGEHKRLRQLVLFGDIAQGGMDMTVLQSLLEQDFFEEPFSQAGRLTPTGNEVEALVLLKRRDSSLVGLDGTGGWGGSTRDLLERDHQIVAEMVIASAKSTGWTADMRYKFANVRTEMWWMFREGLDPKGLFDIKLPLSTRLMTQLTAPIFFIKGNVLWIEAKDDLRLRLGSSTDEADAVIGAWYLREQALSARLRHEPDIISRLVHGVTPEGLAASRGEAADMADPLGGYR